MQKAFGGDLGEGLTSPDKRWKRVEMRVKLALFHARSVRECRVEVGKCRLSNMINSFACVMKSCVGKNLKW